MEGITATTAKRGSSQNKASRLSILGARVFEKYDLISDAALWNVKWLPSGP
jgi:hypothetical protein